MRIHRDIAYLVLVTLTITSPAWLLALGNELGVDPFRAGGYICSALIVGILACGLRLTNLSRRNA